MAIQLVVAAVCVVPSNPGTTGAEYVQARAAITTCDNNERGNCENRCPATPHEEGHHTTYSRWYAV